MANQKLKNANEIENLLVNAYEITKAFNTHFEKTVEILNTLELSSNNKDVTDDTLTAVIKNSRTYEVLHFRNSSFPCKSSNFLWYFKLSL